MPSCESTSWYYMETSVQFIHNCEITLSILPLEFHFCINLSTEKQRMNNSEALSLPSLSSIFINPFSNYNSIKLMATSSKTDSLYIYPVSKVKVLLRSPIYQQPIETQHPGTCKSNETSCFVTWHLFLSASKQFIFFKSRLLSSTCFLFKSWNTCTSIATGWYFLVALQRTDIPTSITEGWGRKQDLFGILLHTTGTAVNWHWTDKFFLKKQGTFRSKLYLGYLWTLLASKCWLYLQDSTNPRAGFERITGSSTLHLLPHHSSHVPYTSYTHQNPSFVSELMWSCF